MHRIEGIVRVQKQAWNMSDIGAVPNFEIRAVSDVGFVYVALDNDENVIGFIYGYHHFPNIHYSHMMAVVPEWQAKGVGFALKKYHYNEALRSTHRVEAIKWTVDPLLPNNAYLNFAKLGCYCNEYKVNYYGDPDSDGVEIYAGIPTDRFKVTWPIHSPKVARRIIDYKKDRINKKQLLYHSPVVNIIENQKYVESSTDVRDTFCVEVPSDFQSIRRNNKQLALDWRIRFRELCLKYFKKGYSVVDYHTFKEGQYRTNFYEFSNSIE